MSAQNVHAVRVTASDRPGMLFALTRVLAEHGGEHHLRRHAQPRARIRHLLRVHPLGRRRGDDRRDAPERAGVVDARRDAVAQPKIYGKRIIVMGGGAQVGQVALGAIAEADRHNIRGERISVDTIPLVGELELAAAVRAVVRLPRVRLLVLAGSLMGGEITRAVEDVRQKASTSSRSTWPAVCPTPPISSSAIRFRPASWRSWRLPTPPSSTSFGSRNDGTDDGAKVPSVPGCQSAQGAKCQSAKVRGANLHNAFAPWHSWHPGTVGTLAPRHSGTLAVD